MNDIVSNSVCVVSVIFTTKLCFVLFGFALFFLVFFVCLQYIYIYIIIIVIIIIIIIIIIIFIIIIINTFSPKETCINLMITLLKLFC